MISRYLKIAAAAASVVAAGCAQPIRAAPHSFATDGVTEVIFESHLPTTLRVSRVVVMMDGEVVSPHGGLPVRRSLFRAKLPEGDHTVQVLVEIDASCGLLPEPHGKLVIKDARSFVIGPAGGGLVHLNAFAREPWQSEEERVELRVTLRGMRSDRWIASSGTERVKHACAKRVEGKEQQARCMVQTLVDQYRARRDIVALLCNKEKLDGIDQALAALPTTDGPARVALETRIEQLGRDAEQCVGEDLANSGGYAGALITWEGCEAYGGDPRTSLH